MRFDLINKKTKKLTLTIDRICNYFHVCGQYVNMKLTLMLSLIPTTWSPRLTNHHSEHMTRLDLKWFHLCCFKLDYCVAPNSSVSPVCVVSTVFHKVISFWTTFFLPWALSFHNWCGPSFWGLFTELIAYVLDFCHLRYRHFGKTQHSMHSFLFKAWTQFGHRQCLCSTCVAITSSVSWWASRLTSDCCVSSKVEIVVLPHH